MAADNALNGAHRQKYLLSGLLACGVCGGASRSSTRTTTAAAPVAKGTCNNGGKIRREELERRVLDGFKHRLLAPEIVEQFARDFQEKVNRQTAERAQGCAEDAGRLERCGARSRA